MKSCLLLVCLTALCVVKPSYQLSKLAVVHEWKEIDFRFPNDASRQAMITQGLFIPKNSVIVDVDVYKDRTFVTTTRFKKGVPATLSVLSKQGSTLSPLLEPYPDWGYHKPGHCHGLTSIFRIKIDSCGRLWALDTGSVNIFTGIRHVCPKKIVIFDLATDKPLHTHRFPQEFIKEDSILTAIEVDVRDTANKCQATYAYVSDTTTYGLIVYDAKNDRSWRITANNFWPHPHFGYFCLQGTTFNLMDGILGTTLSPHNGKKRRTLYYQSLASNTLNYVPTTTLMNNSLFQDGLISYPPVSDEFKTFPITRSGQSAVLAMASNGVLFYSELAETSLRCYNTHLPFKGENNPTLEQDNIALQFNTGIKVIKDERGIDRLWMVTDRLQKLFDNSMNHNEVNYRIMTAPVNKLIAGTNCAVSTAQPVNFPAASKQNTHDHIVFKNKK